MAGVLAHEMSHVALQHGAAEMGKASARTQKFSRGYEHDAGLNGARMMSAAAERSEHLQVGGKPALMTKSETKTSLQQEPQQIVYLYTIGRDAGL